MIPQELTTPTKQETRPSEDNKQETNTQVNTQQLFRSLMMACKMGDLEQVKQCVGLKCLDLNQHDPRSIYGTPLMRAISEGHTEIASLLIEEGADIGRLSYDKEETTALHTAIEKQHLEMVKLLLHSGKISKYSTNGRGQTAEEYACKKTSIEIADYIKQYDHEAYLKNQGDRFAKRSVASMKNEATSYQGQLPRKKRK